MRILALAAEDWEQFVVLATAEGWKIPFQEQRLFQNQWRPCFFVLKERGRSCGFISAVAYQSSGWIGNLLVAPQQRGKGYGAALFDFALALLRQSQPQRIWLTASAQGAPLYRKRGFAVVDRVERWSAQGKAVNNAFAGDFDPGQLTELDCRCWGESRAPLLKHLCADGPIIASGHSQALLQAGVEFWQMGPWLSAGSCPADDRSIPLRALQTTPAGKMLVADILESAGQTLNLRSAGFSRSGSTELMCLSLKPVQISGVMALASLGSIG